MKLKFTKMHGLGNDFIFLDALRQRLPAVGKIAKKLCDRRFGIGADQLLLLLPSKKADFRMEIYNADGGEVEMCGNGLRGLVCYVRKRGLVRKKVVTIETRKGIQSARMKSKGEIEVDMGEPLLNAKEIPVRLSGRVINRPLRVEGREMRVTTVSMGNPHCVIFLAGKGNLPEGNLPDGEEELDQFPVDVWGPRIENHYLFPKRTNVEFVKVLSHARLRQRTWERGAGETLACGSGASAAVVAAHLNHLTGRRVEVELKGGRLRVEWDKKTGHVLMTGPAEIVFEGVIDV